MFFDDNEAKWHSRIYDIPVVGRPELITEQKGNNELDEAIIAMPSVSAKRMRELVKILQKAKLKFETVPSLRQLATGKVKVSQLRSVEIQDLLGREPVDLETKSIFETIQGKTVMVTGAGGSIGSELCRQIASFNPSRLLLVDQSEVLAFPYRTRIDRVGLSKPGSAPHCRYLGPTPELDIFMTVFILTSFFTPLRTNMCL